ncbi:MAG: hypothetical protein DI601_25210 [Azospirillum brasilense]|nr:MAG: hypothetical protein DI601_25210 [Azospirillum brasilense]
MPALLVLSLLLASGTPAAAAMLDSLFDRSFGNLFSEDVRGMGRSRPSPGSDSAEREDEGRRLRREAWGAEKARLMEGPAPRLSQRGAPAR